MIKKDLIMNHIMKDIINKINKKVDNIYDKSQAKVPVKTGRLKSGWFKRSTELNELIYRMEFGYSAIAPGTQTDYAKFVDLGTVKMDPRNYFTPIVKKEFGVE